VLRTSFVFAVIAFTTAAPGTAADVSIRFTNMSGDSITQLTATPQDASEASTQNILTSPIPNGASGQTSIRSQDGICVFTLTFTFASGKILNRPDTDLCQTDGIVIE
jgi:hypothetical protein